MPQWISFFLGAYIIFHGQHGRVVGRGEGTEGKMTLASTEWKWDHSYFRDEETGSKHEVQVQTAGNYQRKETKLSCPKSYI